MRADRGVVRRAARATPDRRAADRCRRGSRPSEQVLRDADRADEAGAIVELRQRPGMGERPVAEPEVGLEHHCDAGLPGERRVLAPQGTQRRMRHRGEQTGRALARQDPHLGGLPGPIVVAGTCPVAVERIGRPIAGRGEIELEVGRIARHPEEEFATGPLPKKILRCGGLAARRQHQSPCRHPQRVLEQQPARRPSRHDLDVPSRRHRFAAVRRQHMPQRLLGGHGPLGGEQGLIMVRK